MWAGDSSLKPPVWKLGCLRFWSHKSVQTPGSAGSGGRKGVRSALAGAEGVPCVMPHRGFGGDAGNDRWPVPAVALTSEHMGAHCVRETWCRKSSLIRHTLRSRSSCSEFPRKCSAWPVYACASAINCRDVSPLKTMSVTQVFSIVPPASGEVDLPLWATNNAEGTPWRQLTP